MHPAAAAGAGRSGAIAIYGLLQQKDGFTPLDHELFTLLGGHAATAIFAAQLYSQSERKLNTIQGFIDLLDEVGEPRGGGDRHGRDTAS